ncbi:Succinate-semialdehyde dehydrogenase [NADP(+)] GabD [Serratia quinivorans]|jgi:succinate-semialdehyde dehydrogenase/glutarate-semialdehyde dehydrogenase|uniref:NAD-dependent succinate-semialdehyde dehydrogenase n=1 Tax=Serratia quinivorans TaxID=137545 RepID=UPI00217C843C|nr:NAD-dependent succinate-semialdehyde dehydrogenase [Serratia quinivorans]CAI0694620.1 Succinate-semialdehyde dehydrogenase [NADP(+)] GabD [Serratia quinivorans]CAI0705326.1 Succinate-semialdehyde dehydrogenase [NADP(+)] GabD [Serratia quinivorans]CAI0809240.1 Succinate-semialdehyde dehydrogenase [NADP(+)] GabD [Serratia quinivorans]CAI0825639.1 Succinate-semialdehyde dehydrogenase [NADP(+)] GabD [Serratia quinivorans]CAI0938054.1 Succinate-semialdehyde dehydrogenase [NADP(+)] GabD [Serratia
MTDYSSLLRSGWYCDGHWRTSTQHYQVSNPATGESVAEVASVGSAETNEAIAAAAAALPAWRALPAKARAQILQRWFQLIMENQAALAELMVTEQGKVLSEAQGEVAYAASFIEWFAEEAKRAYGQTIPATKAGNQIITFKEPVGVIAAITPWNFPLAMLTRKLGPALAAGCTAVIKPANETPLSAFALIVLAELAGVPPGVINAVSGDTPAIGAALMASPLVRKVSFTGSTPVGKLLMRQAADTVKKLSLELGGNAPFIVFDDADLDAAVTGAMAAKFRNSGQTCVCVNRFYIQDGIYDRFVQRLTDAARVLKVAPGMTPGAQQGPLIHLKAVEKVEAHLQDAINQGARLMCGGERHPLGGSFFQPTVLADADERMQLAHEETFGPLAACFRFHDEDEAIRRANDTPFGLAAYLYTRDLARAFRVTRQLESGMVGINEGIISTEVAPFGGVKESGLGREGAAIGLEEYLETKYVNLGQLEGE